MAANEPKNALECARRGWCVFPLPAGAKEPPPWTDYAHKASRNPTRIIAWHYARAGNWGIVPGPSGLLIVDVDDKPGKNGSASLAELELSYGKLPPTFTVATPSGGRHLYFRGVDVFKLGFRPGLDCPQYVLAPGSMLADGNRYTVIDDSPVADAPIWLPAVVGEAIERDDVEQVPAVDLDQPANIARATHHLTHDARKSIQGQNGEFALLLTAGELKDMGISKHKAVELLDRFHNVAGRCDPLWLVGDGPVADRLDVKVENAWRYLHRVQPGAGTAEADFFGEPVPSVAALAEWWKEFDRAWRERHSVTMIDDRRFPVHRPPPRPKRKRRSKVS